MTKNKNFFIPDLYSTSSKYRELKALLKSDNKRIEMLGLAGSATAVYISTYFYESKNSNLILLPDKEQAAYFYNDLENIFGEHEADIEKKKILFYPNSYSSSNNKNIPDSLNLMYRTEVLERTSDGLRNTIVVSYPEAIAEKTVTPKFLKQNRLEISAESELSIDELYEYLMENGYESTDFVVEPGQFSLRGFIIDVYSFNNEFPFRIEFFGDKIASIRSFNPVDQLSIKKFKNIKIVRADIEDNNEEKESLLNCLHSNTILWISDLDFVITEIQDIQEEDLFINKEQFIKSILIFKTVLFGICTLITKKEQIKFKQEAQIPINKNFNLLMEQLLNSTIEGKSIFIYSDTETQLQRIEKIINELAGNIEEIDCRYVPISLHEGFIDNDNLLVMITDHQLFNRYHKYKIKDKFNRRQANIIKELETLNPGDYVTHIEYGIGLYDGLEKIEHNGVEQEALRILYAEDDVLYVNINALSRISKYSGIEGTAPKLHRLGSSVWANLKNKAKSKVRDIAENLIKLYAERLESDGYAFSADTYMQNELEASFMYEDTPDQVSATIDVKRDMEENFPMERLICGDVGFGKTEIAVRAAFKAVVDQKQVAVLVPTTILALQHYKTFSERLSDFPVTIEYINRFKTTKQKTEIKQRLKEGKIDILIGTHAILNKSFQFKDLGLLVIDEEQKFGVAAKEKLKDLKVNVDTLTMTATPIPRTLQFSLMGARDLSILRTPPPNRQPVTTEICAFDDKIIRNAIEYEINRGGQIFFVHNKVQNIEIVEETLKKIVPGISIAVAHGQMKGENLENIMIDFMNGNYDVLLATKIIESGLDIPNVNTIFINRADTFGLSELHQLRGRVGRADKKAFCYLLAPFGNAMTPNARKRLKAIEEFSDLGSGLNIAMRDLDIRGAGNILGAEQSGFISNIGFDMYQKILNEALTELKASNLYTNANNELSSVNYANDCNILIDKEAFIPDDYVKNLSERMRLYQEVNKLTTEQEFINFKNKMIDRFGPIPKELELLIEIIKIKLIAKQFGIEAINIKNKECKLFFVSQNNINFYQSELFAKFINYIQENPRDVEIGDSKGAMTISFKRHKFDETKEKISHIAGVLQKL